MPMAPEYVVASPDELAPLAAGLRVRLEARIERGVSGAVAPHPLFGPLSLETFARLLRKHLNHHLEQYGA